MFIYIAVSDYVFAMYYVSAILNYLGNFALRPTLLMLISISFIMFSGIENIYWITQNGSLARAKFAWVWDLLLLTIVTNYALGKLLSWGMDTSKVGVFFKIVSGNILELNKSEIS